MEVKDAQVTIEGLKAYQNYSVQAVAFTRKGDGLASRSIYCRTKADGISRRIYPSFFPNKIPIITNRVLRLRQNTHW